MSKSLGVDQTKGPLAGAWETICQKGAAKGLVAIAIVIIGIQAFSTLTDRHEQQDFAHYYASSQLWLEGDSAYSADLAERYKQLDWDSPEEPIFQATNPPTLVALFAPFAMLKPQVAHAAWLLLQLVCLGSSCWLVWQCVRGEISFDGFCLVLAVFLMLPFVKTHLFYSQVQLLLLALVLLAHWLIHNAKVQSDGIRPMGLLACTIVAVAALIKIYPLVLLPWFIWRGQKDMSARIVAAVVSVAVIALAVWATGIHHWIDFYHHALPVIKTWMKAGYECFTLSSACHQFGEKLTGEESEIWLRLGSLAGLLLLALFYMRLVFRPLSGETRSLNTEFALLTLLMLFCGGTCWWHYLVFLLFPMQVIATRVNGQLTFVVLALSALTMLLFVNIEIPVANVELLKPVSNLRPLWGMIAMAVFLASCLKSNHPGGLAKR